MTDTTTHHKYSALQRLLGAFVGLTDLVMRAAAWSASKVSRVTGAGAFYYPERSSFYEAWKEGRDDGAGSLTLRAGHIEFVVDYRAPAA